jgi:FdhD protein
MQSTGKNKGKTAPPGKSVDMTSVQEWKEGIVQRQLDSLVAEEPLEIRVNGVPLSVTMRTPGNDLELAAGFLLTEGIIQNGKQIVALDYVPIEKQAKQNVVNVQLSDDAEYDARHLQRNFFAASSCGICGKASIDSIRVRGIRAPNAEFRITPEILCETPERLRESQAIFGRTGGLHGAALFDKEGKLIEVREDVGRHNAVDKVIGWTLLNPGADLSERMMLVSGRGGFEIVQKCLVAGIPLLASVSAPSSLAVRLAREFQMTFVGFLRGKRFVVYAGEERLGMSRGTGNAEQNPRAKIQPRE